MAPALLPSHAALPTLASASCSVLIVDLMLDCAWPAFLEEQCLMLVRQLDNSKEVQWCWAWNLTATAKGACNSFESSYTRSWA